MVECIFIQKVRFIIMNTGKKRGGNVDIGRGQLYICHYLYKTQWRLVILNLIVKIH